MCLIPSLHLFDVKERQSCIASALEYFKRIQDRNFNSSVERLKDLLSDSSISHDQVRVGKTEGKLFAKYKEYLGFQCQFERMARKLIESKKSHTHYSFFSVRKITSTAWPSILLREKCYCRSISRSKKRLNF